MMKLDHVYRPPDLVVFWLFPCTLLSLVAEALICCLVLPSYESYQPSFYLCIGYLYITA
jgi:hypothetical protein